MRFLVVWICLFGAVFGGTFEEKRDWISCGIEEVIQSVDPTALVGVKVFSLDERRVLYERNGACRFIPASSVKLLTMGGALDVLGEDYRFETKVVYGGEIKDRVLKGDCYLVGGGDPSLTGLDMLELVEALDLREIQGDLVVDVSFFEDSPMGPGWMWDEEEAYWSVPMSALNIEHNFVGESVIKRPEELAACILKGLLDRKGILLRGGLRIGKAPEGAVLLSKHLSLPLKVLVAVPLQKSDNLFSNCIFKAMGGSWEKARETLGNFLKVKLGMNPEEVRVVDGSGESRYNLISPHQMVEFLKGMWGQNSFCEALPVGKESGTLKYRMRSFNGRVVGKTGSMTGVSSFCGYVTTEEGEHLAVAIFVNGYLKEGREIKLKMEDEICHILVNAPR